MKTRKKAIVEVYKHRVVNGGTSYGNVFVGISSESASIPPSKTNPFVFSNGTQVKDTNTLVKWKKKTSLLP